MNDALSYLRVRFSDSQQQTVYQKEYSDRPYSMMEIAQIVTGLRKDFPKGIFCQVEITFPDPNFATMV